MTPNYEWMLRLLHASAQSCGTSKEAGLLLYINVLMICQCVVFGYRWLPGCLAYWVHRVILISLLLCLECNLFIIAELLLAHTHCKINVVKVHFFTKLFRITRLYDRLPMLLSSALSTVLDILPHFHKETFITWLGVVSHFYSNELNRLPNKYHCRLVLTHCDKIKNIISTPYLDSKQMQELW